MTTSPLEGKKLIPFIAPPNGGKGTQTKILRDRYGIPTFDMGATFRAILKEGSDPALADELNKYMSQGKLVPLETVMKVFTKGFEDLARQYPAAKAFILDGFPRDLGQANALIDLCKKWGAGIASAVYLNVGKETVKKRATGRRFCTKDASHVYNVNDPKFAPKNKKLDATGQPVKDALGNDVWLCDEDGADLFIRDDDKPETVEKRLVEYERSTNPIIDTFRQRGELAEINGEQPPEEVTRQIEQALGPVLNKTPSLR